MCVYNYETLLIVQHESQFSLRNWYESLRYFFHIHLYLYSNHEFHINVQSNAIEYRAKLKLFRLQWRKKVRKITDAKYLSKVTNTTEGGIRNSFYYLHGRDTSGKEWKYYLNHFMTHDDEEKEEIAETIAERLCISYHGG